MPGPAPIQGSMAGHHLSVQWGMGFQRDSLEYTEQLVRVSFHLKGALEGSKPESLMLLEVGGKGRWEKSTISTKVLPAQCRTGQAG